MKQIYTRRKAIETIGKGLGLVALTATGVPLLNNRARATPSFLTGAEVNTILTPYLQGLKDEGSISDFVVGGDYTFPNDCATVPMNAVIRREDFPDKLIYYVDFSNPEILNHLSPLMGCSSSNKILYLLSPPATDANGIQRDVNSRLTEISKPLFVMAGTADDLRFGWWAPQDQQGDLEILWGLVREQDVRYVGDNQKVLVDPLSSTSLIRGAIPGEYIGVARFIVNGVNGPFSNFSIGTVGEDILPPPFSPPGEREGDSGGGGGGGGGCFMDSLFESRQSQLTRKILLKLEYDSIQNYREWDRAPSKREWHNSHSQ